MPPRLAIIAPDGTYTYPELEEGAQRVASTLLDGGDDLREARVAFMVTPGCAYAAVQRGIWRAGGVAVPLALSHPEPELAYVLQDSGASIAIADPVHARMLAPLAASAGIRFVSTADALRARIGDLPTHIGAPRRAPSDRRRCSSGFAASHDAINR